MAEREERRADEQAKAVRDAGAAGVGADSSGCAPAPSAGEARHLRTAAFRSRATGAVIETGPCHDIACLPGGPSADLDDWEAGFTDAVGRFLDRRQAATLLGQTGRLEARAFFGGEAMPTLEAGHLESWRRRAA